MNKNKLLKYRLNSMRPLVLMAGLSFAFYLLAMTTQAQIAIQDGTPLTITHTATGTAISQAFTVTTGAKVLVVILEDRGAANPEPATLTWNTQTLTRDFQSLANVSTVRCMAIYHLFNPIAGTGNITGTLSTSVSDKWVTAYTLSGVDTTIPVLAVQANTGTSTAITGLTNIINGVPAGAWAAVGSVLGTSPTLVVTTGTGGTTTTTNDPAYSNGTSAYTGYIAGLSAGTDTFTSLFYTNLIVASSKAGFGVVVFSPPSPPSINTQPISLNIFTNGSPSFSVVASGSSPLSYQWYTNNTSSALSNGGNLTGATSNVLTIANATSANAGAYTVVITNVYGAITSSVANLAFISPAGAYEAAVMTNAVAPFAFYTFSETGNPSLGNLVAQDSLGAFNGIYGSTVTNGFGGIAGPRTTADGLVGFPDSNTAVFAVSNLANSFVTVPAFNLNNGVGTNVLTITAWIKPQTVQSVNTGIIFCRGTSTVSGLGYNSVNAHLGYTWNNDLATYSWDSGITPPANIWSLVALIVTPTNATVYILNTNGFLSATHTYAHVVQKFEASTLIGEDNNSITRNFNGAIDEVAFFRQALSQSQMTSLFATASGVSTFPPAIGASPAWNPATVYVGQNSSITVSASGTAPLSYQWMAGVTNSGTYTNLTSGGNIAGATSATLTITNVQSANLLDYVVRVSNAYGVVTNVTPARLTVLPPGPATNFTLNYNGTPVQEGVGADWNTANVWNPGGQPASTSVFANPGSSYELVVGSRLRNPAATTYNVFPGASLIVDGDGIFENGTVNGVSEIRFKNSVSTATTNYFSNLVLKGGQLNIGDSTDVTLQGTLTVVSNSVLYALGTGTNQSFRIDSYLAGNGGIQLYLSNATPNCSLNITGNTNTYSGPWNIVQGPLVGSGANSLGTNTIAIGTNAILETAYDISNANSSLTLNGQFYLHQNDTFKNVTINGVALGQGTYTFVQLNSTYPAAFPATWNQLVGSTANTGSGSITVLKNLPATLLTSSAQTNGYLAPVTFTVAVQTNGAVAGDATGTVVFSTTNGSFSTNVISGGSASSVSVSNLPRGTNTITASYSGDGNYSGTTTALIQVVTNHPPVTQAIAIGSQSGTPVTLQIIGGKFAPTDADGDALLVSAIQNPSSQGGVVSTDGTNVTYTAADNFTGTDTFTYVVNDGFGGLVTNTITASVVANGAGYNLLSGPVANGDGTATVNYLGIPGYNYALETAPSLTLPIVWTPVVTNVANTNGRLNFIFNTSAGQGYFRTRYVP